VETSVQWEMIDCSSVSMMKTKRPRCWLNSSEKAEVARQPSGAWIVVKSVAT
jgi:GTP-dependent phosphoenolpyruvate carboxykinase